MSAPWDLGAGANTLSNDGKSPLGRASEQGMGRRPPGTGPWIAWNRRNRRGVRSWFATPLWLRFPQLDAILWIAAAAITTRPNGSIPPFFARGCSEIDDGEAGPGAGRSPNVAFRSATCHNRDGGVREPERRTPEAIGRAQIYGPLETYLKPTCYLTSTFMDCGFTPPEFMDLEDPPFDVAT